MKENHERKRGRNAGDYSQRGVNPRSRISMSNEEKSWSKRSTCWRINIKCEREQVK